MPRKNTNDIYYTIINIKEKKTITIKTKQRTNINVSLDDIKIVIENNNIIKQQKAIEDRINHINKLFKSI